MTIFDKEALEMEFVRRAQQGEWNAFETLTNGYEGRVYSIALRVLRHPKDAEQVTQKTFLRALRALPGFAGKPRFATWLWSLACETILHFIPKRAGLPAPSANEKALPSTGSRIVSDHSCKADGRHLPEEQSRKDQLQDLLEHALNQLSEQDRLVFLLCDGEGLAVTEAAAALCWSQTEVGTRLLRARLQLQLLLARTSNSAPADITRIPLEAFSDSTFTPTFGFRKELHSKQTKG